MTIPYHTTMDSSLQSWGAGTLHLDDQEFLDAFEACTLPGKLFNHADHIRLARIYVLRLGSGAGDAAAIAIRRYADHLGASTKYHETITRAWMILVHRAVADQPAESFPAFAAAHPHLLDKDVLKRYYSKTLLVSDEARHSWIPPDLAPIP